MCHLILRVKTIILTASPPVSSEDYAVSRTNGCLAGVDRVVKPTSCSELLNIVTGTIFPLIADIVHFTYTSSSPRHLPNYFL